MKCSRICFKQTPFQRGVSRVVVVFAFIDAPEGCEIELIQKGGGGC
jgi:hypothetical protein